ncbi:SDR family NAD(P)-dependent oxidoreductase [Acidocella sp. KAb 2-4]|uniref:SDR family NAD(P)-dependent oxidoreductase n=1 Tax=Acidocella sp. KAb 2-4 TaxID=2885158 RepID=UPI001D065AE5|nr:SDR family oxidoreductase [Acidocella sp. KAb 2-4]MCB5944260.1 SDR family oxidoreductase [Acidocella sp. KAb 2-4]
MQKPDLNGFSVDLNDRVAVVLGASAEGGTGWAVAEALARNGAKVIVGARSIAPLEILADRIGGVAMRCDAGNEAEVAALAKAAVEHFGRLDVAVNAAGLPVMGAIADLPQSQLDAAVRVNLFGNFYFIRHMAEAIGSNGSIVIISSMSATQPVQPHVAYACAKAGTDCLVRYAALEYGRRNIRVNSILPGAIKSDMAREAFATPGFEEAFAREVPLGRVGYPEDFANAVLFLAGPAYVTGANLQINGGAHLTRMPYADELPGGERAYGSGKVIGDR